VIFAPKYVFRVVFEGGFLGGTHNVWGNPYLNSTTVLFDTTLHEKETIELFITDLHISLSLDYSEA